MAFLGSFNGPFDWSDTFDIRAIVEDLRNIGAESIDDVDDEEFEEILKRHDLMDD